MFIFDKISTLQDHLHQYSNSIVGFVPTMGALHQGHLQLIKEAKSKCEIVVVSIFVNPLQFNNSSDFEKYPVTIAQDSELLKEIGCDILFIPQAKEMYASKPVLRFDFGILETVMEGKYRPGHFNGVAIVVSKLFHIVAPQKVFFGQKDFQQCAVISKLIKDLSFNMVMETIPTIREKNGLAMSSRNTRLSEEGRERAALIYKGLSLGKKNLEEGKSYEEAIKIIENTVTDKGHIEVEYIEIADTETLLHPDSSTRQIVICFAGFLEGVRLIDNIVVDLKL